MAFVTKCIVILSLILAVTSLTAPHDIRNVHHHRALAVRSPAPAPAPAPALVPAANDVPVEVSVPRKDRSLRKRCRPGHAPTSTTPSDTPTSTSSDTSTSTQSATPTTVTPPATPVNVEPSPTVSETPSAASTQQPKGTSTTAAAAPTTSDPPFLHGTQTGDATFFATGLGACGIINTDADYICAVSELLFDQYPGYDGANPNDNPVCNRLITASWGGKTATVKVVDRCTECSETSLDFTPTVFGVFAPLASGRLTGMTWVWT